jgi:hypothetical protein
MRKTLLMLAAAFLFAVSPAFAQHGGGHASGGHGFGGGSHAVSHESHNSGTARNASNASHGTREQGGYVEHHDVAGAAHAGYHYSGGGYARNYWHGGRYDHEYFAAHWGYGNRFYMGHCNWWGPRFGVGSYFWFGGGYWTIINPIPVDWYDDEVYVDYVDGWGYVLINPLYPHIYYQVGVRF